MADTGSLIQGIVFSSGKIPGNLKAFHPLPPGDIFLQYHILYFRQRHLKINGVNRLGLRASRLPAYNSRKLFSEGLSKKLSQLRKPPHIPLIQKSVSVGRHIQIQAGVGSHAGQIGVKQPSQGMGFLFLMPEPSRPDGHIKFRRCENQSPGIQNIRQRSQLLIRIVHVGKTSPVRHRPRPGLHLSQMAQLRRHHRPLGMAGHPRLITAPADIRTEIIENHRLGLVPADQFDIPGKIVFLPFALRPLAAGVVKPHIKNLPVFCQQLRQLIAEIVVVRRRPVIFAVPVPGRQIKAEFDAAPAAGLRCLPHHIPFAGAVLHGMFRVF